LLNYRHASSIYFTVLNTRLRVAIAIGQRFYPIISRLIPAFIVVIEKGDTTEVRIVAHTYPSLYDMGVARRYAWEILNTITQGLHVKPVEVMDVDYMNSPESSSLG
jgi:hypothetical protein